MSFPSRNFKQGVNPVTATTQPGLRNFQQSRMRNRTCGFIADSWDMGLSISQPGDDAGHVNNTNVPGIVDPSNPADYFDSPIATLDWIGGSFIINTTIATGFPVGLLFANGSTFRVTQKTIVAAGFYNCNLYFNIPGGSSTPVDGTWIKPQLVATDNGQIVDAQVFSTIDGPLGNPFSIDSRILFGRVVSFRPAIEIISFTFEPSFFGTIMGIALGVEIFPRFGGS